MRKKTKREVEVRQTEQTGKLEMDRQTYRWRVRQAGRQTKVERQTDGQADEQVNRRTDGRVNKSWDFHLMLTDGKIIDEQIDV
jgi:hypothetical protein